MASTQVLKQRHLLQSPSLQYLCYRQKYTAPTVKQAVHKKYNMGNIKHPKVKKVDLPKVGFGEILLVLFKSNYFFTV